MRICKPACALFSILVLSALSFPRPVLSQMDDLEKEFFQGQTAMEKDYKDFEKAAFEEYQREVRAMWNDFVTSTKKDWVEYSGDKTARSVVDFESGEAVVEVVVPKEEAKRDPEAVKKKLAKEVERLVTDKGKSRDYDIPVKKEEVVIPENLEEETTSEKTVEMIPPETLSKTPVLEGQLKTKEGDVVSEKNKKEFAQEVVTSTPIKQETLSTQKGEMVKAQVTIPLVPDYLRIRAEIYLDRVRKNAQRFDIDVPLAFAVMHTESYFNPKATSPVPAYGLMQLVPRSGGRDAYRYVHGKDKVVSADYLYNPDNNVELGVAYLGILKNRYFRGVQNPENALYCAIASYNTGAGNLSRSLTGTTRLSPAIDRINTMQPEALYSYLRNRLPYKETQEYLKKVSERMKLYQEWK